MMKSFVHSIAPLILGVTIASLFFFFVGVGMTRAADVGCGSPIYAGDNCTCTSGTQTIPGAAVGTPPCCGWAYNGVCNTEPQYVACGGAYPTDSNYQACVNSCPASSVPFTSFNGTASYCCGWVLVTPGSPNACLTVPVATVSCGNTFPSVTLESQVSFQCGAGCGLSLVTTPRGQANCCGWQDYVEGDGCSAINFPTGTCVFETARFEQATRQVTIRVRFNFSQDTGFDSYFPAPIRISDPSGTLVYRTNLRAADCSPVSGICTVTLQGDASLFSIEQTTQAQAFNARLNTNELFSPSFTCQTPFTVPSLGSVACGEVIASGDSAGRTCACRPDFEVVGAGNRVCCGWPNASETDGCSAQELRTLVCGQTELVPAPGVLQTFECSCPNQFVEQGNFCCGYPDPNDGTLGYSCLSAPVDVEEPPDPGGATDPGLTAGMFTMLNQAIFGSSGPNEQLTTPRGIISRALPYLFTIGGLILFIMTIWGGFEMLSGATNPKSQEAGKQRITAAIIGFLLLFASYWLAKLVEIVFGISIL